MKKILYYLPSIIFNVIETLVIFLVGISLNVSIKDILLIFIIFAVFNAVFFVFCIYDYK